MIGTELLQLLQGDPLAQMRSQIAGPNPNPQAPPPQPQLQNIPPAAKPPPGAGTLPAMHPVGPQMGGGPAPQGAPPAPSAAPQPLPALPQSGPPSTAPQSPPDLASIVHAADAAAAFPARLIDHGLAMISASALHAALSTQGQDHALEWTTSSPTPVR